MKILQFAQHALYHYNAACAMYSTHNPKKTFEVLHGIFSSHILSRFYTTGSTLLNCYIKSSNKDKVLLLTYEALRQLGINDLPNKTQVSSRDIESAWDQAEKKYSTKQPPLVPFPQMENNHVSNLINLALLLPSFDPRIQSSPIFIDLSEALPTYAMSYSPQIPLPFTTLSTQDSQCGQELLHGKIKDNALLVEDGSNGQDLLELTVNCLDNGIPVQAIGMNILAPHIQVAQLLTSFLSMEHMIVFATANALHRKDPRPLGRKTSQRITLAYQLIPVFNEEKIHNYLQKISKEMKSGDLWCGSIALPEGFLYEQHLSNHHHIQQYNIRAIPTSFGGTTFVHHPTFTSSNSKHQISDEQLIQDINNNFSQYGFQCTKKDFYNVVLNTYMTTDQFEQLTKKYGLKVIGISEEIVTDNKRVTILTEKI